MHFFEHTVAPHFHFGEEQHDEVMMNPAVGLSALVGLSIHTFFDGVSIASGFLISIPLGLLIFFAVILHKIPEGVTVATIALASGQGKRRAMWAAGDPGRGHHGGGAEHERASRGRCRTRCPCPPG